MTSTDTYIPESRVSTLLSLTDPLVGTVFVLNPCHPVSSPERDGRGNKGRTMGPSTLGVIPVHWHCFRLPGSLKPSYKGSTTDRIMKPLTQRED